MWTAQQEDRFRMCTDDNDALNWATTKLLSCILKCSYFLSLSVNVNGEVVLASLWIF